MKKFLSALIAFTMLVAPTRTNICGAESSIPLVFFKEDKQKGIDSKETVKQVVSKTLYFEKVLSKVSAAMKSFKEFLKEHGKKIFLGVASTVSYNLVKNLDKVKEILVDTKLSFQDKIKAFSKVIFCGVKEPKTEEPMVEKPKTEEPMVEKPKTEETTETQDNTENQNNQKNQGSHVYSSVLETAINTTYAKVVKLDLDEVENINKTSLMNNLDEQCKVGSIVDCDMFGINTCCEYTDENGTIKSEELVKGSPVKEYTIAAVVSLVGICFFITGCYIMNC